MIRHSLLIRFLVFQLLLSIVTTSVSADWVQGTFSERSGIDSLQRIVVLRDIEIEKYFGGNVNALGDISGDGISDILVARREATLGETSLSFLFYGGNPPDTTFVAQFDAFLPNMGEIGDINGDGYGDLAGYLLDPTRFSVQFGGPAIDDIPDWEIPSHSSFPSMSADIDDDGNLDIPVSINRNGDFVDVFSYTSLPDSDPEYTIPDTATDFGYNVAVGEFNGDGYSDLAVAASGNRDTSFVKLYWGGPDFDTIPDLKIESTAIDFGYLIVPLSDFDGDGHGDLFISGKSNDSYGIYFGGPSVDNQMDVRVNDGFWPPSSAHAAGDLNNDGLEDLLVGYSLSPDVFQNRFFIFLAGGITEFQLTPDVLIDDYDVPGGQSFFGKVVKGIGDFDGDGIDDFAVSSNTASSGIGWTGEVNIFSGWDSQATDVPYEYEPTLPNNYELNQNYPNPFNPSTTIRFSLPVAGQTQLVVYNTLGEQVTVLISSHLSAGTYGVEWDGKNGSGANCASGVYLYTLKTENTLLNKKMLLLK